MKSYRQLIGISITAVALAAAASLTSAQMGAEHFYGMGFGMMDGYGGPGYGMGLGMMGHYSGFGQGQRTGVMGWEDYEQLNLNADQRAKITQIQKEVRTQHWSLMGKRLEAQDRLRDLYDAEKLDAAAINKQYKEIEDYRRQMVESSIDARNRINGILTKDQREKLREGIRHYEPMMRGSAD